MHGIMEEFEEFQIGDASYNASLDQVYHKAKIIFDQLDVADNALHFSVFLIPWKCNHNYFKISIPQCTLAY